MFKSQNDYLQRYLEGPSDSVMTDYEPVKKKRKTKQTSTVQHEGIKFIDTDPIVDAETTSTSSVTPLESKVKIIKAFDSHTSTSTGKNLQYQTGVSPMPDIPDTIQRTDSDLSPPRKSSVNLQKAHTQDDTTLQNSGDLSPPRRKRENSDIEESSQLFREDTDISPPRRKSDPLNPNSVPLTMSTGERAGLHTGTEITLEAKRKREEYLSTIKKSHQYSEPEEVVYRDQDGRRIIIEEKKEKNEDEDLHVSSTYSGTYKDDEELNTLWRNRQVWDDPLARLESMGALEDSLGGTKKMSKKRKRSEVSRLWKGWYPPNRFNIPPGAEWDGVDRSNGFERKLYQSKQEQQDRARIAYQIGSSDL